MKIGIYGYGFVGQAIHAIIKDDVEVVVYDIKEKYKSNKQKLKKCEIIFICVPTPSKNLSIIKNTLDELKNYKSLLVIKSTVSHSIISIYSKYNIVFNPEFLNQNTFIEDSLNQKTVIIGGTYDNSKKLVDFYKKYTTIDSKYELTTLKEACDIKYTRNLYGAYKVLFWEFIQDTTGNARKMHNLYKKLPVQSEMGQVGMDGFRGYGGACFPKDTENWHEEHKHKLTKFMIDYNNLLHKYYN